MFEKPGRGEMKRLWVRPSFVNRSSCFCSAGEVNLTALLIYIHWLLPFVCSFKVPQMLVWTNQHLDSVLMCHWEDPLKILTFDMAPRGPHCPQLSPTSRGKTIQSICPLGRSKPGPPPLHSISMDSTFAKSLYKWDCASALSWSVFERRGNKQRH